MEEITIMPKTLSTMNNCSFHLILFVASLSPCYLFLVVVCFLVSWLIWVTLREVPVACTLQKIENKENTLLCTFAQIYRLFFLFKNRLGTNGTGFVSWMKKIPDPQLLNSTAIIRYISFGGQYSFAVFYRILSTILTDFSRLFFTLLETISFISLIRYCSYVLICPRLVICIARSFLQHILKSFDVTLNSFLLLYL